MLNLSKIKYLNKFLYILIVFLLFASSCVKQNTTFDKNSNIFDLSKEKFDDNTIYNLSGQWEFYWDTILAPSQIKKHNKEFILVNVPNLWTNYKIDGKYLPSFGYATYHTKIILPKTGFYSLKFKRIFLSCNIFINDSLIYSNGKLSTNPKEYIPSRMTREVVFPASKDTLDLTIQVANFSHKKAGIVRDLKLGLPKAIIKMTYTNLLYDMFIFGALGFMMIFYFILYFYNKSNKSNLFFSIFLLSEILLISLDRELIFFRFFPNFSWEVASKIYYIAAFLRIMMFAVLIESFTKGLFSKKLKNGLIYFTILISIFIILTPMRIYSYTLILIILLSFLTIVYETIISIQYSKNDKTITFAYIGLIIIIISIINDGLYEYEIIKTFYSTGLSIFIFTLLQSILLSIKNTSLLNKEESLKDRDEIQNKLKKALLNTPSYDLAGTLQAIIKNLEIEKIILFTLDEQNIILSITAQENITKDNVNERIDLSKEHFLFEHKIVKFSFENKQSVQSKNFSLSDEYRHKKHVRSIVTLPLLKNDKVIALIYFENKIKKMSDSLINVLQTAQTQFYSLISTAVTYFNLIKLNTELDEKVKIRTVEVEKQKDELDEQNQQLDEKIQLLEEQYAIQKELNNELETNITTIEKENVILENQNKRISTQKEQIEKHTDTINLNISYANKILSALSSFEKIHPFKEFFHLDLPKNIVSGDFFWSKRVNNDFIFALADSTGHGVPGALMRMFANQNLSKIINKSIANKIEIIPHDILNQLRNNIKINFSSESKQLNEGLDIAFCKYNLETKKLYYSGAYSSVIIISNHEINIIKGDRMPVGKYIEGFESSFTTKIFQLKENDIIYLFTDGYVDQFNSENNQKYYISKFKNYLLQIHKRPLNIQKNNLFDEFYSWKGNFYQLDDVSVIGAKI